MKVIDEGHSYLLQNFDNDGKSEPECYLYFVKREGEKYPGNEGSHPGTIMQEAIRAIINRCRYVNAQKWNRHTDNVIGDMQMALWRLEVRHMTLHGGSGFPYPPEIIASISFCLKCGHIMCYCDEELKVYE